MKTNDNELKIILGMIAVVGILFGIMFSNIKPSEASQSTFCDDFYGKGKWQWHNNCTINITQDSCISCVRLDNGRN